VTNPLGAVLRRIDAAQQGWRPASFVFAVVKKYGDDQAGSLAALLTYYGFLSLLPLLLLLVTVTGLLAGSSARVANDVQHSALAHFPVIGTQLRSNLHGLSAQSGVALGIAIFGLLWGSMGASQAAQHAMAEVWNLPYVERPSFLPRLVRSLLILVLSAVFLVVSSVLAGVTTFGGGPGPVLRVGSGLATVVLDSALFLAAYRILTPGKRALRDLMPGSVLAGIAWAVLQGTGTYLIDHQLRHANEVYGFFGLVLGLLWWLYLTAQVVLYGAEVNVVRRLHLWPRSLVQPPLTPADRTVLVAYATEQQRRPEEEVSVRFDDDTDVAPAERAAP
jgi:YihY family inner membrane protein